MIQKNKVSSYVLYAIGEVFLVVIGILIAVSINEWNEQRIKKKQSHAYLQRLNEDAESILNATSIYLKSTKRRLDYSIVAKDAMRTKNLPVSQVDKFNKYLDQYYMLFLTLKDSNTYKEMLSSGDLNLIENRWIRDSFAELANLREFLITVNQTFFDKAVKDADKFAKYVHYDVKYPETDSTIIIPSYDFNTMAADTTLSNLISKQSRTWYDIMQMFQKHRDKVLELHDSIQSELKKSTY